MLVLVCESLLSPCIRPVFIEFPPVAEIYGMISRRCTQGVERVPKERGGACGKAVMIFLSFAWEERTHRVFAQHPALMW